jgi:hypothetical protein
MEILTKRPEHMSFEEYKINQKINNRLLKHHKKGHIVWLSKLYPSMKAKMMIEDVGLKNLSSLFNKGVTFKGKVKDLK